MKSNPEKTLLNYILSAKINFDAAFSKMDIFYPGNTITQRYTVFITIIQRAQIPAKINKAVLL